MQKLLLWGDHKVDKKNRQKQKAVTKMRSITNTYVKGGVCGHEKNKMEQKEGYARGRWRGVLRTEIQRSYVCPSHRSNPSALIPQKVPVYPWLGPVKEQGCPLCFGTL